ncbi:DUF2793 domain-containing protein [Rhizobium sp. 18055]|uniref:DUF2793 domain-containing protein n=1 Tax=Rhizobium sp. 18055 TaxID=2681403 RepID=UPI001FCE704A|nr:DUF2793 domain-containing protein [Rhizobium sp. 18055]
MDRINGAGTIDIGGGRRGFRDENLEVGTEGTEVTALFMNMTQEEIIKIIEAAGLVLNDADWTQFYQALKILGLSAAGRTRRWTAVNSITTTAPPGAPVEGDVYLIPAGATGVWNANIGKLAEWTGTAWSYVTSPDGQGISLPDGRIFERIAGVYIEKLALDSQSGKWNYAAAAGTANALTVTLAPIPATLASLNGAPIRVKAAATNTGAATLNVNGFGAVPIVKFGQAALTGGEIPAGETIELLYNGTSFQLFTASSSLAVAGASTTKAPKLITLDAAQSANVSVPSATDTLISFGNTVTNSLGTSTWNGTRLTVGAGEGGFWSLRGTWYFSSPTTGAYAVGRFKKNGAVVLLESVPGYHVAGSGSIITAVGVVKLVPGDYVEFAAYHQAAGTQPAYFDSVADRTHFAAQLISAY